MQYSQIQVLPQLLLGFFPGPARRRDRRIDWARRTPTCDQIFRQDVERASPVEGTYP